MKPINENRSMIKNLRYCYKYIFKELIFFYFAIHILFNIEFGCFIVKKKHLKNEHH